MVRSLGLYLAEIFESTFLIQQFIENQDFNDFEKKRILQDATVRNLIIIGEATKHFPDEIRERFSEIQWSKIVGLRNIAVHMYHELNYQHIWEIINVSLPEYIKNLEEVAKHILEVDQAGFDDFINQVKYHIDNPN